MSEAAPPAAFEPRNDDESAVAALYHQLLDGWNRQDGEAYAAPLAEDADVVGFDGSQHSGRSEISSQMQKIFDDHATGRYVGKVRQVRLLAPGAALLRAVAGMVPAGHTDLKPELNAIQTIVAARLDDGWRIALFQNTPAQFHGQPELAESLTAELREALH
jgi:uncharacterized protein (TIGR02246 family)